MSTHKSFDLICVAVLVFTVLLTILFMNGSAFGIEIVVDEDAENNSHSVYFTKNDRDSDWNTAGATHITLSGGGAVISGGGAYTYDGDLIIANAGRYVVSGTLTDGSIIVDTNKSAKVWILLDGVELSCADDACLRIDQADKVFLTLAEGSVNTMSSGEVYSEAALADGTGGVIYAHDDLTINGSGSLALTAAYMHGVDANDELVIAGGSITVDAVGDALHVRDALCIADAVLSLTAGDDGIDINSEDGYYYMESGSLSIVSGDDAIHTVCPVLLAGGELNIAAADDAIHSDSAIRVSGGTILVSECCEGLEAVTIEVSGGEITVHASDDGLNANGGSGFGMMGGPWMMDAQSGDTQSTETDETWIHISGGSITVINENARDADGLDSNGDIIITGGSIRISLSGNGSNSAIDYGSESGGVCEISGGDVVACGSYTMAEGFSDTSTQCSILYNISSGVSAGTTVSLEDADGNVLIRYEAPCSFSSVCLSTPELKLGENYLIVIGEKAEAITLEEVSASYGNAQSEGFGGTMNWGGMQQRGRMENFGGREEQGADSESADGTAPARPSGRPDRQDFGGERPEMSEMPQRPEGSGQPQPPEMPEGSDMPQMPEMEGEMPEGGGPDAMREGQQTEVTESGEEVVTGPQTVSAATWVLLCACFAVLAFGVVLAVKYRP